MINCSICLPKMAYQADDKILHNFSTLVSFCCHALG
jgi:hypothetical protein